MEITNLSEGHPYLTSQPKTKRGRETLEKICRSAEELFGSQGYHNTSINDIARGADAAPGTFYIYFKDKLSAFRYLVDYLNHSLRREIAAAVKGSQTRYEEEHEGFKAFFSFLNRHRGLFKIIWEAQFVDPESFRNYYENIATAYSRRLAEAQGKGEIREDLNTDVLAYCFVGIVNFVGLKWIIFDDHEVGEEVIDELMKFLKEGAFRLQD